MQTVFFVLHHSATLGRVFGRAGADVIEKGANPLLATFGVSLVRRGLLDLLTR